MIEVRSHTGYLASEAAHGVTVKVVRGKQKDVQFVLPGFGGLDPWHGSHDGGSASSESLEEVTSIHADSPSYHYTFYQ